MSLQTGARLGPYEILSPLGAGGMGEVYKARDTRLHRDVAIKVLPSDVSADPDRRKRFHIEARAIAALHHPHICAIHDIGAEGDIDYLVLELLEGETLAARLRRGPMPVVEALARARELADALSTAHRQQIVHRDLKPGNVMLTKPGAVILDFGLARIVRESAAPSSIGFAETTTGPATQPGAIIGTLQYMAPEQIEGRPTDARADVFVFGAVLYEMLTGRHAFEGSSGAGLMGAILRAETPSVLAAQPAVPESVDRLIHACLMKDPGDRIASLHDVDLMLAWAERDAGQQPSPAPPANPARSGLALAIAAIVVLTMTGMAYFYGRLSSPHPTPQPRYVYDIPLPTGWRHWAGLALAPTGRRVAIVTQANGLSLRLWRRDLDSSADWQLVSGAGGEFPKFPFWSPDGQSLASFADHRLLRVDLPSVTPVTICAIDEGRGGVWLPDGTIVFGTVTGGLMRVDARGGTAAEFIARREDEVSLRYPVDVGHGRLLYWVSTNDSKNTELRMVSVRDPRNPISVLKTAAGAAYDQGTLFFLRDRQWFGQPFDPDTPRLFGVPTLVPLEIPQSNGVVGAPAVAAGGGNIAASSIARQPAQATWLDRTGRAIKTIGEASVQVDPDLSPDGRRIAVSAYAANEGTPDIWVVDADTGERRRLTTTGGASQPIWRDAQRIDFQSLAGIGGIPNPYEINADDLQRQALVEGPC